MAFNDLEKDEIILERLKNDRENTLSDMAESLLNPKSFTSRVSQTAILSEFNEASMQAYETKNIKLLAESINGLILTEKTKDLLLCKYNFPLEDAATKLLYEREEYFPPNLKTEKIDWKGE
jgi:hypothetical protein